MKEKLIKNEQLRNNEYYRAQQEYDYLYAESRKDRKFNHLIERIIKPNNIRLAYRNLKGNKGSKAKGISGKNILWVAKLKLGIYIKIVQDSINNYIPGKIRSKEIPKANGKVRRLGIKEPIDKIIEQVIYQILDPIVTAKFHNNSNGFIKKRSTTRAISQLINIINKDKYGFAISLDIKACFDNINHPKLLKQLWTLGIRDKNLLSLRSKMLKAEIIGIGIPDKGTP